MPARETQKAQAAIDQAAALLSLPKSSPGGMLLYADAMRVLPSVLQIVLQPAADS